ncbi:hypothetical protein QL992_03325 [Microbacterium sp. APC 3898]|uniref:DUF3221 domain-containing protein n=2 Tax=Planococcus TaxID=1372 RepID=A0ABT7ZN00_9BACL|nr:MULTISPECIES: hypothetical protein [Terrabacteria group]MBD8015344.1 hypothetical protein [Planococcus wigleyi]MDN3428233.1 hypothetical protein [Planococcus sp. APC 4016]MDN3498229.1 hypothetical protein [Microbacterium sp. APC 3898]
MINRLIITLTLVIFLIGCPANNSSDYEGFIEEIKENSIVIVPPMTEREGDYPVYEIFLSENTEIDGAKDKLSDLERGDKVKIRIEKAGANKEVAEKILVEN